METPQLVTRRVKEAEMIHSVTTKVGATQVVSESEPGRDVWDDAMIDADVLLLLEFAAELQPLKSFSSSHTLTEHISECFFKLISFDSVFLKYPLASVNEIQGLNMMRYKCEIMCVWDYVLT